MNAIDRAIELRKQIESNASMMPDETAADYAWMFPRWSGDDIEYLKGVRVRYDGILYKCLQTHNSQVAWNPTDTPSLWTRVLGGQDDAKISEWEQPDSTNPYIKGDIVTFDGSTYKSLIDNNVWSPQEYPDGWQKI